MALYEIRKGDTVTELATRLGVTAERIMRYPQLFGTPGDARTLLVGASFDLEDGTAYGPNVADEGEEAPRGGPEGGEGGAHYRSSGGEDYTTSEDTRFNGLPGHPDIWKEKDTGRIFAVYYVPNSSPPIPLLFAIPKTEDLESFFGNKAVVFDREINRADIDSFGSVRWGTTNDIPTSEGDPWVGFVDKFERAKETQPWLNDPEVFGVFSAAWLEGREPEKWELESTDWWQDHTEAQREWAWLKARNPAEADRQTQDNLTEVYNAFVDLGLDDINDQLVAYMAEQFTMGDWSSSYLSEQIQNLFDPSRQDEIDEGLSEWMLVNKVDITGGATLGTNDVRAEWDKWLGPGYPPTDEQVSEWAAKVRRGGAGAQDQLENMLRGQRKALYPSYEDENLTYQDIAGPWRGFATNAWGETIDETDPMFQEIVRMNDAVGAGKLLRKEGMKQGIGQVNQDALTGLMGQTSTVRKAV